MAEDLAAVGVAIDFVAPSPSQAPAAHGWGERAAAMPVGQALGLLIVVMLAWLFLQALKLAERRTQAVRISPRAGPPRGGDQPAG
jgi:hypothetical protein